MLKQLQTSTLVWWFSHHPATLARNSVPHPLLVWVGRVHKSIVKSQFGGSPFGPFWNSLPYLIVQRSSWHI